jgi:hypothetical protein
MLHRFLYWMRTGERPLDAPGERSVDGKGKAYYGGYSIQVKENVLRGYWEWRLLRDGEVVPRRGIGQRTEGAADSRSRAIKQAEELIDWCRRSDENLNQQWEDV